MEPKYKRVLLKLSGEALAGDGHVGIDYDNTVLSICRSIKECVDLGVEVAIVVGGGNFWRGRSSGSMDRTRADHMGMLATVINALALCDALESMGVDVRVQTAIAMTSVAEPYIRNRAVRYEELSFSEMLAKDLAVMDLTAATMCKDNHIPVMVFSLEDPHNIVRAVCGEDVGTIVKEA